MGAKMQQIAFGAVVAAMLVVGAYTGSQGEIVLGRSGGILSVSLSPKPVALTEGATALAVPASKPSEGEAP